MEEQLAQARQKINGIDQQIVRLLEQRFAAVVEVNDYKRRHQLPVLDSQREKQVLQKIADLSTDKATVGYLQKIFAEIMHQSREYQHDQRKED